MTPSRTHASLLDRLKNPKDTEAWTVFASLYEPLIRNYLYWLARPQEADLDNLTQDVLTQVFRKITGFQYDPSKSFRSWLRTVAYHVFCSAWRKRPRTAGSGDSDVQARLEQQPAPDDQEAFWEREYDLQCLRWAAAKVRVEFDAPTYEAFRQHALEGRPLADVAQALGLSLSTVFRAKEKVLRRIRVVLEEIAAG